MNMYQTRLAFFTAREKANDDVKTISSKLAKAKKEDPNLNAMEFLDQLKKENPAISNKAFALRLELERRLITM